MKIEIEITDEIIDAIKQDMDATNTAIYLYYDGVTDSAVSEDFINALQTVMKFHQTILDEIDNKKK